MAFQVYGISDIGCAREANEDSIDWLITEDDRFALAILADGMGGYEGGEVASSTAVSCIKKRCGESLNAACAFDAEQAESLLLSAGRQANEAVLELRVQHPALSQMGTTLLVGLAFDKQLILMHAGDSRCYKVGAETLQPLTRDHSMVQQMLDEGVIKSEDVSNVPFRNMLTRAVGVEENLQYSITTIEASPGEQFLLCSDGLFNALNEQEIHRIILSNEQIGQQVHKLIEQSLLHHASDNVSAILLHV